MVALTVVGMNMSADWDDLRLFLHVAEEGGLSGASARTGLSAPTIGRRILSLERRLGRSLFHRSQQGYKLAHDGQVLAEHVRSMQRVADSIADWHKHAFALPIVAIAAEGWISGFIADHSTELRKTTDEFRYCCRMAEASLDLTYRSADVAILGRRPEQGNLAAKPSVKVSYAVYGARTLDSEGRQRWISIGTEMARTPADRWVFENQEPGIYTWCGSADILLRLVRGGNGLTVLPAFVGDGDPLLERHGGIIRELEHPLFIVANDDDRRRPEVRLVIDRLAELFKRNEARFVGEA
jgi:DNA-binding transcriptional LysR family regulator